MTPMQAKYVHNRVKAGMTQERAAVEAGYSPHGAAAAACRLEHTPYIQAAMAELRQSETIDTKATIAPYDDAQSYLEAVALGQAVPDAIRVAAAKAILPYQKGRQRAPKKSLPPRALAERESRDTDRDMLDRWAEKAAEIRRRMSGGA